MFISGSVGYALLDEDLERNASGTIITGNTEVDRVFASGNVTGNLAVRNFRFRPSAGVVWLRSKTEAFSESNGVLAPENLVHFAQVKAGARLSHVFALRSGTNFIEPFILGQVEHDFKSDLPTAPAGTAVFPVDERTGGTVGGGMYFYIGPRISGGVEFSTEVGRDDFSTYSVTGNVRFSF